MADNTATAVYVPYATFISALDGLRQHGIPRSGIIDKSIWDTQSGTVRAQLILAFKFLGLIDDQRHVAGGLEPLVLAAPEERKKLLRAIVEEKYKTILSLDLTTISQGQLDEAFRKLGVSGSTLQRAIRFFVKACVELGIPIAKRFSERTRASGPRKKRAPNGARRHSDDSAPPPPPDEAARKSTDTWEQQLLGKFPSFDPSWPDQLKTKWFEGFERLMGAKPE